MNTTEVIEIDNSKTLEVVASKQRSAPSQVQRPLTRKQKAFVKYLIENPKDSASKAIENTYNVKDSSVARSMGSENLAKPSIQSELAKHGKEIEQIITDNAKVLSNDDRLDHKREGLLNARWIHDKIHGKAKQITELTSTGVVISVDLTSALDANSQ